MIADQSTNTEIARNFVEARRSGVALTRYPGDKPAAMADAYRIQDEAIALTGRPVAGWKVGKIDPPLEARNRLAGPIFADQVTQQDGAAMPVFAGGFAAAEAEFLLRLGTAPRAGQTHWSIEEASTLIDAVHVGIEIASSPYPRINADGPLVTISDFGNNNGLVVGAAIPHWASEPLADWPVALLVNGEQVGAATAATMLDGPFGAVRFLLEHAAARGLTLEAGQWISTGAVTGVHPVAIGDHVEARFGPRFRIGCTIVATEGPSRP